MIGAIIGDIVGSRFEFQNHKEKEYEFFMNSCSPTDDSIMTLAIAKAIMNCRGDYSGLEKEAIRCMQKYGRAYPDAGYGWLFYDWIFSRRPKPYGSYGNGAAMRVSPCGFVAASLEEAGMLAYLVTKVTHNHPESIKAAEAVSSAIYLGRTGKSLKEIREFITENYYLIDFTLDEIRLEYSFDMSCQRSVPQAFEAFFESTDFEDAIRNATSIGGDSDTIAAITGGMAEAYYGVPEDMREQAIKYLDTTQRAIIVDFEEMFERR